MEPALAHHSPEASQAGEVTDAVFGEVGADGPNYRSVGWVAAIVLLLKSQIGLGVLSVPSAFNTLGMAPGIIILIVVAAITTWTGYVIGTFKLNHPEVYGIDDAGGIMFGRAGREFLAIAFCLYWLFVSGSAMLGVSIGLNAVSAHGTCTAVFVAVAAAIGLIFASIRTLGRVSWLAWVGTICVLVSIFTLTIATGVQDRPADAPREGPWASDWKVVGNPTFAEAMSAVASLVLAYGGLPAYFSIASEMKDPRYYTRSVLFCQGTATVVYIIIGVVVYYYCGSYVASPALGSAGVLLKKICYGLVLPGLLVTEILYIHLTAKYVFVRALRNSKHLTSNSWVHWTSWLCCTLAVTIISYCIASGVPVFGELVSMIGALFGTLMCFHPMACMWLFDNWKPKARTLKWYFLVGCNLFILVGGSYLLVSGTYGAVVGIEKAYTESGGSAAWSCEDNSNSV